MAGLPVIQDPNNLGDPNILDTNYVTRSMGTTAQNWAGPAMAAGSTSVANAVMAQLAGNPNPQDKTAGYLAVGQPEGANNAIIPNTNGNGAAGGQLQAIGSPAGLAGGGSYYPNVAGASGVPNPFIATAWQVQAKANEDLSNVRVAVNPSYGFVHGTAQTITPTISGGTSPYTVTLVESIANGVNTNATLPTGITLAAATGVLTLAVTTVAGTYQLGFRVADSESPVEYATYEVTVVLS
jgi:hypothetical protein